MRKRFIMYLATQLPAHDTQPPSDRPSMRPMFKSNHRGPGSVHGKADPEMARQLVLSLTQQTLLNAGVITWAGFNVEAFVARETKRD